MQYQKGFSLFEVLIALSLFAIFFVVFASSFFHNQKASAELNEEMIMSTLAERATRQILIDPPALNENLSTSVKKESFEDPYKEYSYSVEWKKLELPNFSELMNLNGENESANNKSIMDTIFKQVQEATKEIIWQLRLTIIHNPSMREYPVTLWVKNPDKELSLSGLSPKAPKKSAP